MCIGDWVARAFFVYVGKRRLAATLICVHTHTPQTRHLVFFRIKKACSEVFTRRLCELPLGSVSCFSVFAEYKYAYRVADTNFIHGI